MAEAFRVFVNGITGVFLGMGLMYLMMKLVSFSADRLAPPADPAAGKSE
ncbi:MAG: hypothetical protein IT494_03900 [Gammaproteobacteria bacterium]|nr:hypothetical protein [Gammaproteobacteria bacterium]